MSSSPSSSTAKDTKDEAHVEVPVAGESTPPSDTKDSETETEEDNTNEETTPAPTTDSDAAQWQAIWSPDYNAYYFFNATTQQTTWTNPIIPEGASADTPQSAVPAQEQPQPEQEEPEEPEPSSSAQQPPLSAVAAKHAAIQAAALAQGIDPLLAHLDPSLVASATAPGQSVPGSLPTFTAQFNARTGRFTSASSSSSSLLPSSSSTAVRTPAHLSEYERAKRMSSFYFDVDKWEEDLAKRGGRLMADEAGTGEDGGEDGEGGKKRKRPSKKDIERFKEQKKQKKIAKTAWLRT